MENKGISMRWLMTLLLGGGAGIATFASGLPAVFGFLFTVLAGVTTYIATEGMGTRTDISPDPDSNETTSNPSKNPELQAFQQVVGKLLAETAAFNAETDPEIKRALAKKVEEAAKKTQEAADATPDSEAKRKLLADATAALTPKTPTPPIVPPPTDPLSFASLKKSSTEEPLLGGVPAAVLAYSTTNPASATGIVVLSGALAFGAGRKTYNKLFGAAAPAPAINRDPTANAGNPGNAHVSLANAALEHMALRGTPAQRDVAKNAKTPVVGGIYDKAVQNASTSFGGELNNGTLSAADTAADIRNRRFAELLMREYAVQRAISYRGKTIESQARDALNSMIRTDATQTERDSYARIIAGGEEAIRIFERHASNTSTPDTSDIAQRIERVRASINSVIGLAQGRKVSVESTDNARGETIFTIKDKASTTILQSDTTSKADRNYRIFRWSGAAGRAAGIRPPYDRFQLSITPEALEIVLASEDGLRDFMHHRQVKDRIPENAQVIAQKVDARIAELCLTYQDPATHRQLQAQIYSATGYEKALLERVQRLVNPPAGPPAPGAPAELTAHEFLENRALREAGIPANQIENARRTLQSWRSAAAGSPERDAYQRVVGEDVTARQALKDAYTDSRILSSRRSSFTPPDSSEIVTRIRKNHPSVEYAAQQLRLAGVSATAQLGSIEHSPVGGTGGAAVIPDRIIIHPAGGQQATLEYDPSSGELKVSEVSRPALEQLLFQNEGVRTVLAANYASKSLTLKTIIDETNARVERFGTTAAPVDFWNRVNRAAYPGSITYTPECNAARQCMPGSTFKTDALGSPIDILVVQDDGRLGIVKGNEKALNRLLFYDDRLRSVINDPANTAHFTGDVIARAQQMDKAITSPSSSALFENAKTILGHFSTETRAARLAAYGAKGILIHQVQLKPDNIKQAEAIRTMLDTVLSNMEILQPGYMEALCKNPKLLQEIALDYQLEISNQTTASKRSGTRLADEWLPGKPKAEALLERAIAHTVNDTLKPSASRIPFDFADPGNSNFNSAPADQRAVHKKYGGSAASRWVDRNWRWLNRSAAGIAATFGIASDGIAATPPAAETPGQPEARIVHKADAALPEGATLRSDGTILTAEGDILSRDGKILSKGEGSPSAAAPSEQPAPETRANAPAQEGAGRIPLPVVPANDAPPQTPTAPQVPKQDALPADSGRRGSARGPEPLPQSQTAAMPPAGAPAPVMPAPAPAQAPASAPVFVLAPAGASPSAAGTPQGMGNASGMISLPIVSADPVGASSAAVVPGFYSSVVPDALAQQRLSGGPEAGYSIADVRATSDEAIYGWNRLNAEESRGRPHVAAPREAGAWVKGGYGAYSHAFGLYLMLPAAWHANSNDLYHAAPTYAMAASSSYGAFADAMGGIQKSMGTESKFFPASSQYVGNFMAPLLTGYMVREGVHSLAEGKTGEAARHFAWAGVSGAHTTGAVAGWMEKRAAEKTVELAAKQAAKQTAFRFGAKMLARQAAVQWVPVAGQVAGAVLMGVDAGTHLGAPIGRWAWSGIYEVTGLTAVSQAYDSFREGTLGAEGMKDDLKRLRPGNKGSGIAAFFDAPHLAGYRQLDFVQFDKQTRADFEAHLAAGRFEEAKKQLGELDKTPVQAQKAAAAQFEIEKNELARLLEWKDTSQLALLDHPEHHIKELTQAVASAMGRPGIIGRDAYIKNLETSWHNYQRHWADMQRAINQRIELGTADANVPGAKELKPASVLGRLEMLERLRTQEPELFAMARAMQEAARGGDGKAAEKAASAHLQQDIAALSAHWQAYKAGTTKQTPEDFILERQKKREALGIPLMVQEAVGLTSGNAISILAEGRIIDADTPLSATEIFTGQREGRTLVAITPLSATEIFTGQREGRKVDVLEDYGLHPTNAFKTHTPKWNEWNVTRTEYEKFGYLEVKQRDSYRIVSGGVADTQANTHFLIMECECMDKHRETQTLFKRIEFQNKADHSVITAVYDADEKGARMNTAQEAHNAAKRLFPEGRTAWIDYTLETDSAMKAQLSGVAAEAFAEAKARMTVYPVARAHPEEYRQIGRAENTTPHDTDPTRSGALLFGKSVKDRKTDMVSMEAVHEGRKETVTLHTAKGRNVALFVEIGAKDGKPGAYYGVPRYAGNYTGNLDKEDIRSLIQGALAAHQKGLTPAQWEAQHTLFNLLEKHGEKRGEYGEAFIQNAGALYQHPDIGPALSEAKLKPAANTDVTVGGVSYKNHAMDTLELALAPQRGGSYTRVTFYVSREAATHGQVMFIRLGKGKGARHYAIDAGKDLHAQVEAIVEADAKGISPYPAPAPAVAVKDDAKDTRQSKLQPPPVSTKDYAVALEAMGLMENTIAGALFDLAPNSAMASGLAKMRGQQGTQA